MASTSVSRVVQASPDEVWNLIGGFHSLPDWLPHIPQSVSEQGGRERRPANADGEVIIEQLTAYELQERSYAHGAGRHAPMPDGRLLDLLADHGDSPETPAPMAIGTSRDLLVATLRSGSARVLASNPMASHCRDRHGARREKSQRPLQRLAPQAVARPRGGGRPWRAACGNPAVGQAALSDARR
ncbi:SRPBCC family protein [Streptomyces sp. NPDC088252]|uniref:SRPBCC family protein n=1 Tax=Streptomyces sp. NPDC088252 TaxID=3365845 RepID=UPI0038301310